MVSLDSFSWNIAIALLGLHDDHVRLTLDSLGPFNGILQCFHVMAVHYFSIPAEACPAGCYSLSLLRNDIFCITIKLLAVKVLEGDKSIKLLGSCKLCSFPNLSFLALSVSYNGESPGVNSLHPVATGNASCCREALAQGAGCKVNSRSLEHIAVGRKTCSSLIQG